MTALKPMPAYIINLEKRVDRKANVLDQFKDKDEFNVTVVNAVENVSGNVGLWDTIKKIIGTAEKKECDYVLICEDDHVFTEGYQKEILYKAIENAKLHQADILLGGVSWTMCAMASPDGLYWTPNFSGTQFLIVFQGFFKKILECEFFAGDTADFKISALSSKVFFMYPFISVQKEFGYSDATSLNNNMQRVTQLFETAADSILLLEKVDRYYKSIPVNQDGFNCSSNIVLPTYIINLPERKDRLEHIKQEFSNRPEFDVTIVEACKNEIGALGLWMSIRKVVELAMENDDDVIIICEDDHKFTEHYTKEYLLSQIYMAHLYGADYIAGGIGGFSYAVPINKNLFWINPSFATQFIVVYRRFFQKILDEPFDATVVADILLASMTSSKMVLYPFISMQKDFGYSDVTEIHNTSPGIVNRLFLESQFKLKRIQDAYLDIS